MEKSLSEKDRALYTFVDEIIFYHWDPVGVSDSPEARDEYRTYLPQIFLLLRNGATQDAICGLLARFQTDNMGMPLDEQKNAYVASMLISARVRIDEM
jgi:hypothetical protein